MRYPTAFPLRVALRAIVSTAAILVSFSPLPLSAKPSAWQDLAGAKFRGEPVEVLGPLALFKTSSTSGRRVLMRGLAPEDILRFHREIASRPARAARWADAKGAATSDLIGHVLRVENQELVPADLSSLPEPELLLAIYGSHNDGESWAMIRSFTAVFERAQRVYPGKLGAVFYGVRHSEAEHRRITTVTSMPWLVANFRDQNSMSFLRRYRPEEGAYLMLFSRDGVPLFSTQASDLQAIQTFADKLTKLLGQLDPNNPRSWPDRWHYLSLTRPVDFAQTTAGPLLIGDPFQPDGLRQRGVSRVDARLAVAADGEITSVELLPSSEMPEAMRTPLVDALRKQAGVLPAIERGTAVASVFDYRLIVPPENRALSADTSWLNGEAQHDLPLASWLVLKPIRVEGKYFMDVEKVAEDDTVMLKALQVSSGVSRADQMDAFNSDWFTDSGAASVQPVEGDQQMIDGRALTWQRVVSRDGLIDFGAHDYSVGYAWTEFESPAATDAWLGLGSDDGVKIWLNGQLGSDRWIRRMSRLDDDVVPLRLKKGKNQLLIKIQNATGDWSFIARLRTR